MFKKWFATSEVSVYNNEELSEDEQSSLVLLECEGQISFKVINGFDRTENSYHRIQNFVVVLNYDFDIYIDDNIIPIKSKGTTNVACGLTEGRAYEIAINSTENGGEKYLKKLKNIILKDYMEHKSNRNLSELKKSAENLKPVEVKISLKV